MADQVVLTCEFKVKAKCELTNQLIDGRSVTQRSK